MIPPATVSDPAATERLDFLCITTMRTRVVSMPPWETLVLAGVAEGLAERRRRMTRDAKGS